ncbi:putative mitochondrial protein, partial [Mucuna pruriens]
MIVIGDDEIEKLTLEEKLTIQFEMKELGKLKYFIGIEVTNFKQELLKEREKLRCKISRVPIEQNHKIGCEESSTIEKSQYHILVGKLIYLSSTRPNISYVICVANQFMHNPNERHLQAILYVFGRKYSNIEEQEAKCVDWFSVEMKIIFYDLKVKYEGLMKLFYDNNSAISIVHNPVQHMFLEFSSGRCFHQRAPCS